jgi:holo-[acyl-carrier protein] synthase
MNVIGHGIDVVELERFARLVEEPESDFLSRSFTADERSCTYETSDNGHHIAGRFAAKEAVAKALGTGFDGNVGPMDIEVFGQPSGAPTIKLHGGAAEVAAELKISRWLISVSHSQTIAMASAIALGESELEK